LASGFKIYSIKVIKVMIALGIGWIVHNGIGIAFGNDRPLLKKTPIKETIF